MLDFDDFVSNFADPQVGDIRFHALTVPAGYDAPSPNLATTPVCMC
jgi:hypothetical protein